MAASTQMSRSFTFGQGADRRFKDRPGVFDRDDLISAGDNEVAWAGAAQFWVAETS